MVRNMELTSYHQPEEFGKGQKERRDASPHVLPTSQNPSWRNPPCLSDACATRKDPESEWLAGDNPETNPINHKTRDCEPCGRAVLLGPLTLLLSTQVLPPRKSLLLCQHVSLQTIHFQVLDKSPLLVPGRGPPSYNILTHYMYHPFTKQAFMGSLNLLQLPMCEFFQ